MARVLLTVNRLLITALFLTGALLSCGQKGPLYIQEASQGESQDSQNETHPASPETQAPDSKGEQNSRADTIE